MAQTPEQRELNSIYNFYKDAKMGFATKDGYYAIPSDGKKLCLMYKSDIIKWCRNEESARNEVERQRQRRK